MSLFFDILLPACPGIDKDDYLKGVTSNHVVPHNQRMLLRQSRMLLWNCLHDKQFSIKNITIKSAKHLYMNNERFDNRMQIFHTYSDYMSLRNTFLNFKTGQQNQFELSASLSHVECLPSTPAASLMLINSICEKSCIKYDTNAFIFNSQLNSSRIDIGENCYLTDLKIVSFRFFERILKYKYIFCYTLIE